MGPLGFGFFGNYIQRFLKSNPLFYPLYANFFFNRKLPIIIDMNNLMTVYLASPVVRPIIDRKAEMLQTMEVRLYKKDTKGNKEEILDHPVLDLLRNPNPLQTFEDFIAQWSIYMDVYATSFIFKLRPYSTAIPKVLWLLPPGEMKIVPTGKLFQQSKVEDIIAYIEMYNTGDGTPFKYYPQDVIMYSQGTSDRYWMGESKLLTNKIPISNIQGALKTRNILINEKGAIGILSNESGDGSGGLPLDDDERKLIAKDYSTKYGLDDGQQRIIMTSAKVKWNPMSYPTKDLMLFEEIEDDKNMLCDEFGMARDLFSSTKGATNENFSQALKQTYQTTIAQAANRFLKKIKQDPNFGIQSGEYCLEASFEHVPALQKDEKSRAEAENQDAQARAAISAAITGLNTEVQAGTMSRDAAIVILIEVFEFEKQIATNMIGEKIATPPTDPANPKPE